MSGRGRVRPDECTNMPDNGFQVIPLRAFTDNYVWTLRNAACAAVVDPGEARPVLDYLAAENLLLVAILATHHHQDHVGGIAEILETHAVPVYGPRGEPITTLTHPVGGGDRVAVEQLGVAFEVLDIPGHARAHCLLWFKHAVLWRYAVRLRVRARVRGHAAAAVRVARKARGAAR